MTRYTGTLDIRAIESYHRALPQMSDSQLAFLLKCASYPTRLDEPRALIIEEMGHRVAIEYENKHILPQVALPTYLA